MDDMWIIVARDADGVSPEFIGPFETDGHAAIWIEDHPSRVCIGPRRLVSPDEDEE